MIVRIGWSMRDLTANVMNKPPLQCCRGGFLYTKAILYIIYRLLRILIRIIGDYMQEVNNQENINSANNSNKKSIGRKILLVLEWLIIFPIPLSRIIKSKIDIPKSLRIILIILTWLFYISILGQSATNQNNHMGNSLTLASGSYTTNDIEYVKDPVINRFINEFNEKYPESPITDISKGNIRTKYHARVDGRGIEMINATEAAAGRLSIKIYGGDTVEGQEEMYDVFRKIVQIVDPTISIDDIDETISYLKPQKHHTENSSNIQVGKNISIDYFPLIPDVYSGTRIDMHIYNYK